MADQRWRCPEIITASSMIPQFVPDPNQDTHGSSIGRDVGVWMLRIRRQVIDSETRPGRQRHRRHRGSRPSLGTLSVMNASRQMSRAVVSNHSILRTTQTSPAFMSVIPTEHRGRPWGRETMSNHQDSHFSTMCGKVAGWQGRVSSTSHCR